MSDTACLSFNVSESRVEKAWSVGAKIVNGPGLFNFSTRLAVCKAVTSVARLPACVAVPTKSVGRGVGVGAVKVATRVGAVGRAVGCALAEQAASAQHNPKI